MLLSGMVATAAGIAVVLGHNVWSGGALPVVVTLVGWAALLMGVALLLVRTTFEAYDEGGARQPE